MAWCLQQHDLLFFPPTSFLTIKTTIDKVSLRAKENYFKRVATFFANSFWEFL